MEILRSNDNIVILCVILCIMSEGLFIRTGKRSLLGLFGVVFGMQIGFKLSSRQLIWLLNPCHMLSFIQLFLLVSPNTKFSTYLFR